MITDIENSRTESKELELGIIICKYCSRMIGTLPTNGYKKMYGMCPGRDCLHDAESAAAALDD